MSTHKTIEVTAKDLPLQCPMPNASHWDAHPRVFLTLNDEGTAVCPYCGTAYQLKAGEVIGHHH